MTDLGSINDNLRANLLKIFRKLSPPVPTLERLPLPLSVTFTLQCAPHLKHM